MAQQHPNEEVSTIFQDIEHFELKDIIDLDQIDELNQAFALAIGFAATVADLQGNPIVPPCNHSRICRIIRSTPKGLDNCMRSGKILGQKAHELKRPYASPCYSIGFVDAAAPIIVKGKHIANWLVGQANLADVDSQRVVQYAREIGANEDEMLNAFLSMNSMSQREFDSKLDFLWRVSQQISALGYRNLQYSRALSLLQESQNELKQYKIYLEHLVEERTEELNQALKKTEELSQKDPLTGCFNRQHLNKALNLEIKRSQRYNRCLSVMLTDIDHFKAVNDKYGHQCGDHVLIEFTKMIRHSIREGIDWVFRYGGEEFLIVLPETDLQGAFSLAERIRQEIEMATILWQEKLVMITASFGLAAFDPRISNKDMKLDSLIGQADRTLYKAKAQGRNTVVCQSQAPDDL
ncbi:MAG: diguanylate cyclase [Desulfovermiculus sp.]|nr:diguanylate cyclase [Desulfovermiculus sp.]